jgi:exopolysaccharide biosynthesis polyprenyl glycosylphosphotransferase
MAIAGNVVGVYGGQPADRVTQEDLARLVELGRGGVVDSVVVAAEADAPSDVAQLVEQLKILPVEVAVCADRDWLPLPTPDLRILAGVPVAVVAERPLRRRDLLLKTLMDKLGALTLILIFAPLMLAISMAIAMTSKGPVIFRQKRQGWCGREFTVLKFRTMVEEPTGVGWASQTERNDVRCTRVGRFLRRTSLDELPQFWNVVLGDMSLVGPRPHADCLHGIDRAGKEIVAEYAQRYRVKPGITGWAQIHGARGATNDMDRLRQRVEYDLYYIEHWSLWLDLQILFRTMFCLFGENVY